MKEKFFLAFATTFVVTWAEKFAQHDVAKLIVLLSGSAIIAWTIMIWFQKEKK